MGKSRTSGIGIIMRDKVGSLQAAQSMASIVCSSPLGAKAIAVLEGLRLARSLDVRRVTVLSDSLNLVKAINQDIQSDYSIASTL